MENKWKVIWVNEENKKKVKRFDEIKEAVSFRDELREDGLQPHVVSARHAYKIPVTDKKGKPHKKAIPPDGRYTWCPYCIDWRIFTVSAVRFEGIRSPEASRCPICTISDADYFVQAYNHRIGKVDESKLYKGVVTMHNVKA